jgi:hypothetical protein
VLYHRAAGLVAAFLLIPQLLGIREIGCPRHGGTRDVARAAATAAAPAAPSTQGHEHHHQDGGKDAPPSKHHAPSDCCPAMNSCSGAAIRADNAAFNNSCLHNDAPALVAAIGQSRVESPDPPPPKA